MKNKGPDPKKIQENAQQAARQFVKETKLDGFHGCLFPISINSPEPSAWTFYISTGKPPSSQTPSDGGYCGLYVSAPGEDPGMRMDTQNPIVRGLFSENPKEPVRTPNLQAEYMFKHLIKLKGTTTKLYPQFLETRQQDIQDVVDRNDSLGSVDECIDACTSNLAIMGTVWKGKTSAVVGSFPIHCQYEHAFIKAPEPLNPDYNRDGFNDITKDSILWTGYMGVIQFFCNELPFVQFPEKTRKFPQKTTTELTTQLLYYFHKKGVSPLARVDVIAVGGLNVGKTTIFKTINDEEMKGIGSTNWYEVYAHVFEYSPEDALDYQKELGQKMTSLQSKVSAIFWDLGGQSKFWDKVLGRGSLPVDLIPDIGKRVPHVLNLVYAADDDKSLDKLREYASLCKEKLHFAQNSKPQG